MVYTWGFKDWYWINAAPFYACEVSKFRQIHAMFLTYLPQPKLLGDSTSALQNYRLRWEVCSIRPRFE